MHIHNLHKISKHLLASRIHYSYNAKFTLALTVLSGTLLGPFSFYFFFSFHKSVYILPSSGLVGIDWTHVVHTHTAPPNFYYWRIRHLYTVFNCLWGRGGVVISTLDFRSEGRWFEAQSHHQNSTPHCFSPPRCINTILSVASCYSNRDKLRRFGSPWLVCDFTLEHSLGIFLFPYFFSFPKSVHILPSTTVLSW